jgi:CRP-like cAMP-binding protein
MGRRGDLQVLFRHPLFDGVDVEQVAEILRDVTVKEVPRGMLLHTPGIAPALLHLVLRGRLRAYQVTPDGRELLLELIQEGGFDGVLSVVGRRGHFTAADDDSAIASLSLATLEELIAAETRVVRNLLGLIIDRLERREIHLEAMALHDPSQRLARQLLALGRTLGTRDDDGVILEPKITHQMLADMLGVRRETITLHLGRLGDLRAVSVERGRLRLNVSALRRIVRYPGMSRTG